jgi:hypothetical protein
VIALRRSLLPIVLSVLGTVAGVWVTVSPWALGLVGRGTGWSALVAGCFWAGIVLTGGSLVCLVALLVSAVWAALRLAPGADPSPPDSTREGSPL